MAKQFKICINFGLNPVEPWKFRKNLIFSQKLLNFFPSPQKSVHQWQQSFILASIVAVITYIMFQIYGTAEVQSWNYPKQPAKSSEEEEVLSEERSTNNED